MNFQFGDYSRIFNRTAQNDPLKVHNFFIEIEGFKRFGFKSCTGLGAKVEQVKYREGGDNTTERKSPGLASYPDITLTRGQILADGVKDSDIMNWFRQVFDVAAKKPNGSNAHRRTVEIVQVDREGNEAARWKLAQAWPTEIKMFGDLDALQNEDSLTTLVICYEGFE